MRPQPIPLRPDRHALERDQRRTLHRLMAATTLAKLHGTTIDKVVEQNWPNDTHTKAAVNVATTANTTTLVPVIVGPALTGLAPSSAAARLFEHPSIIKLDFKGVAQYAIPRGATVPTPIFIAEAAPFPMHQLAFASTVVGPPKKILLGSAMTSEMEFSSGNTLASVVGTLLAEQASLSFDTAVFDAVAGDAARPAGLLNGLSPIAPTAAGGNTPYERLSTDLANMANAISAAGISITDLVLVAGAGAAVKLKLLTGEKFDYEILPTTGLPATTVVAIAPAGLAVGFTGAPVVELSKDALVHFETVPAQIGTAGSPNAIAAPTRSLWQQDMLALKVRLSGTWAVVKPGAVQVVNSVTW